MHLPPHGVDNRDSGPIFAAGQTMVTTQTTESRLDTILFKVAGDDAEVDHDGAHGLCLEPVPLVRVVDQVGRFELETAADEVRLGLVCGVADRAPAWALDAVVARTDAVYGGSKMVDDQWRVCVFVCVLRGDER